MVPISKVRIYEIAKETGLSNKAVLARLADMGIEAKSHSSSIDAADAKKLMDSLGEARAKRQAKPVEDTKAEAEQYDLEDLSPSKGAKANRIVPPHLRGGGQADQEESPEARPATPPTPVASTPEGGTGAPRPATAPVQAFRPAPAPSASSDALTADGTPVVQPDPERPAPTPAPAQRPGGAPPVAQRPASTPPADEPAPSPSVSSGAAPAGTAQGKAGSISRPLDPRQAAKIAAAGVVRRADEVVVRPAPEPHRPVDQTAQNYSGDAPAQPRQPRGDQRRQGQARQGGQQRQSGQQRQGGQARQGGQQRQGGQGTPGVPRPGTPPRPGQPTAGQPAPADAQQRRRIESNLPREGSGKRHIPPPLKAAPANQHGGHGGGAGRPGGRPSGDRHQPQDQRNDGPAAPRPGQHRPKSKKKSKGDMTPQEQFEAENRSRQRRKKSGPVKATVEGPIEVMSGITVNELAKAMGVNPTDIIGVLFRMGEMVTVTQSISDDLVELVGAEMEADIRFVTAEMMEFGDVEDDDPADLVDRAPVVTVMGHVDHGKTKLLDAIRHADVVSGEAGGITQHIGAYQVTRQGRKITFIDTPGHEAFTAMRARGAKVTDVAVLVVAADDGVKPQTVEAIDHIKAADVPIIVAVNKIDKEGADPIRVRTQLTEYDLIAEEFGGQTTMVDVSALKGTNLDELLDLILLQADVQETKANPNREASGTVIEANLDRGRGAVATVLVRNGTLRQGDNLVAGIASCRVRAMFDDQGERVTEAEPAKPVQVLGWSDVPSAGDEFRVVEDERTAREIAAGRADRERKAELANRPRVMTLDTLSSAVAEGELTTVNLVIKGDVSGTVEAVAAEMNKLNVEGVRTRIVRKGVGAVTTDDVVLAEASNAIIIAFNVRPESNARHAIDESGVDLRQYSIIYKAIEDVEAAIKGMLAPEIEEVVLGRATVREVFKVPRAGFVFGSYVTEGVLRRNASVRVIRDGVVVADDQIASLRRFKDDVAEVATNYECGVGLTNFQDIKAGDEFECYTEQEVART
ncbi:translation initiation factor IF-2 [Stomatohabitans albus]|uniref:translation initiation factor IF-2 n=1 Tax=Stomatohabitans albus TaxID=3110766 RepID=UPI00300C8F16